VRDSLELRRSQPMIVPHSHLLLANPLSEGTEFDGGNGFTGETEERRRTEGRSIGRRAKHADSRDVSTR